MPNAGKFGSSQMSFQQVDLTPKQIVEELDRYIVGQTDAKRAVAIALRNRIRRQRLPAEERAEIVPKNILMIGPTGVGKTEIARRLAQLANAPFIKVEATKFTEVGYVGRDVDSMIRDLAAVSVRMVEIEKIEEVKPIAEDRAIDRVTDLLVKPPHRESPSFGPTLFGNIGHSSAETAEETANEDSDKRVREAYERQRRKVREQVRSGARDEEEVEIEVEESASPFLQVFSPQGMEEMGFDIANQIGGAFGGKQTSNRRVTVREAKAIFAEEEAKKLLDRGAVVREALERTEQSGIIFLDEIDKVAGRSSSHGPDVSREGVQRDLLPIIEGSTVQSKFGPIKTDHILFICAGAFHMSKPSDLIPELQGRLPIRVELKDLTEADLRRILLEPKSAITKQYQQLLSTDGVTLEFTPKAIDALAHMATEVNMRSENIGARRLHTIMERLLEEIMFDAPQDVPSKVCVDEEFVRNKLTHLVKDVDLSKYIL